MQAKRTRVLIIGGGFGGVYTAITLEKLLKANSGIEVGLISKENYLVFQPMLPEVISGSIGILDTIAPIRRLCPKTNLYTREVESIDLKNKTVTTSAGFRPQTSQLEYDHLVIAVGNVTSPASQDFLSMPCLSSIWETAWCCVTILSMLLKRQISSRIASSGAPCLPSWW